MKAKKKGLFKSTVKFAIFYAVAEIIQKLVTGFFASPTITTTTTTTTTAAPDLSDLFKKVQDLIGNGGGRGKRSVDNVLNQHHISALADALTKCRSRSRELEAKNITDCSAHIPQWQLDGHLSEAELAAVCITCLLVSTVTAATIYFRCMAGLGVLGPKK